MAKIVFSMDEKHLMKIAANTGHNSWSEEYLNDIKRKIKTQHLQKQRYYCCYCSRGMHGEFNLVIDIEHILPKSLYVGHMFTSKNISVSCKRCNMLLKNNDTSFINEEYAPLPKRVFRSRYYNFVHPNLDSIESHIKLVTVRLSMREHIIKYFIVNSSAKGKFNYDYFELEELEINTFDKAQGIKPSVTFDDHELSCLFKALAKNYG